MTWEELIFWILIGALVHSYVFFPVLLRLLLRIKKAPVEIVAGNHQPTVSVLIAAYNEEKVIEGKIKSVLNSDYPKEKMTILVGSDCSTDRTDSILNALAKENSSLQLHRFDSRSGKIRIINSLARKAGGEILILTDANVLFDKNTIAELVKHYQDPKVGLVDSNMLHRGVKKEGISAQEQKYIQTEVGTKNAEGKLWGCMMGPFGGCYSIRKELYSPVPENFLVDDFYINMKVLEKKYYCINEKNAKVYEDVSNYLWEEFRRKIRIATGNYQNLFSFYSLLFRFNAISFCFFSHKVLRWKGPWIMLSALALNLYFLIAWCSCYTQVYWITFYIGIGVLGLPILDLLFKTIGVHIPALRYATHFFSMNLALFAGFFKFLGGVKSSIWQPTKRNQ